MTRARRNLWLLIGAASLALGLLTRAVAWPPGPVAGFTVAVAAFVLVASGGLALRILIAATRHDRW